MNIKRNKQFYETMKVYEYALYADSEELRVLLSDMRSDILELIRQAEETGGREQ